MTTVSLAKSTDSNPSHCDGNRSTVGLSSSVAWGLRRNDWGSLRAAGTSYGRHDIANVDDPTVTVEGLFDELDLEHWFRVLATGPVTHSAAGISA